MMLARAAQMMAAVSAAAPREFSELLSGAAGDLSGARVDLSVAAGGQGDRVLPTGGLQAALAELAERAGAAVDLRLGSSPVPSAVATAAWFCVSEAVSNARKHAAGSHLAIMAHVSADTLTVEVIDDGPGGADPSGGGLGGLRARAAELGGMVLVQSAPGLGTRITLNLPVGTV